MEMRVLNALVKTQHQHLHYQTSKTCFDVIRRSFLTASLPELSEFPKTINSHESLHKFSIENRELFWSTIAKRRINWFKEFTQVTSGSFGDEDFRLKWFADGKLNVSVNCVDRHYKKTPNKVALIWEKDEPGTHEKVTYKDLYELMNRLANMLRAHGIKKGDRVCIYLPCSTMAVAAMLACARIGAVHNVVFAGFSAEALSSRINDSHSKIVITSNQAVRGGKAIDLKKTVDAALESSPSVTNVFVWQRTNKEFKSTKKDVILDKTLHKYSTECEPEVMDAEDPLFMLYTSGSTGKPKGLVHTQAGYLVQASFSHQVIFNYQPNDVFGCLADVGWITGHTYIVYAPLANGGTSVLFESTPTYPNPGRYWETVQRLGINQLYIAPTSLRLLFKYGDDWVNKYDRSSLKLLGSVGEPINHEAWHWFHDVIGEKKCKITDTWWQTETGSTCISPTPCDINGVIKPAMGMRAFLGIDTVILDDKGNEQPKKSSQGILAIRKPWPSMARTIYGDHTRFIETYLKPFKGYYFTGDGVLADGDGHLQITGRVDDVINVSGHRIGTAEIEDVLDEHHAVAESAVVGINHDVLGEVPYAFVILKENMTEPEADIISDIKKTIKSKIAGYAVPHHFLIASNLPKTRSGKIMRRVLRKIASDKPDEMGDLSTLSDPAIVEEILAKHRKLKSQSSK